MVFLSFRNIDFQYLFKQFLYVDFHILSNNGINSHFQNNKCKNKTTELTQ